MSQFIVDSSMVGTCSVPMSLPLTEIPAQSPGIPISQFYVQPGQVLMVPYLSVHLVQFCTLGFTGKRNTALPAVYAGVYYQHGQDVPQAQPILYAGTDIPGIGILRVNRASLFSAPGIYRVIVVNNHASSAVACIVTGTAQLLNVTQING